MNTSSAAVPNDNNWHYTSAAFVNKLACVLHNTILALVHCNAISRSMSYELHMSAEHYSSHLVVLCGLACCLAGAGRFTRLFSDPGISRWAPHEPQDSAHDVIGRDHAPIVLTCSHSQNVGRQSLNTCTYNKETICQCVMALDLSKHICPRHLHAANMIDVCL